jgi:hypothetical protein
MLDTIIVFVTFIIWLFTANFATTTLVISLTKFKFRDWNWLMIVSSLAFTVWSIYAILGYTTPYVSMLDIAINVQFSWMFLIAASLMLRRTNDNRRENQMIYEAPLMEYVY